MATLDGPGGEARRGSTLRSGRTIESFSEQGSWEPCTRLERTVKTPDPIRHLFVIIFSTTIQSFAHFV